MFWRELALVLVCVEIAIFILVALADHTGAIESEQQAIALFPTIPGYYTVASESAASYVTRRPRSTSSGGASPRRTRTICASRRFIEANRLPEARQVVRDALAKEPANAAALALQKQIGAQ